MGTQTASGSPAELVAIIHAAHVADDKRLKRAAQAELRERFGMRVVFVKSGDRR